MNAGGGKAIRETFAKGTQFLLSSWREGNDSARDRLIERLLPELQQIAAARLRRDESSSLSTHDLINEAIERIVKVEGVAIENRSHFLALSSRVMRNLLVDHARLKAADKRQHRKVELNTRIEGEGSIDLHRLDSALIRLEAIQPELMEIVEMRFFGGMTIPEISDVTGWSDATVKRRWQVARAWLHDWLVRCPLDE